MNKLADWIDAKIGPIAFKISRWGFVTAVAGCFVTLMPIIMLGAFASLFSGLSIPAYQTFIKNTGVLELLNIVLQFTTNFLAVYAAFAMAYNAAQKDMPDSAVLAGITAVLTFFILNPLTAVEKATYINFEFLGAKGLLGALLVGYGVYWLFKLCYGKKIYIHMPKGVPPAVTESFKGISPGLFACVIAAVIYRLSAGGNGILKIFYSVISAPFNALSGNILTFLFVDLMRQTLWFFGIHGGNVMSAISKVLFTPPTLENIDNFARGLGASNIISNGLDACAGGGQIFCLGLCIWCLLSKKKQFKELGKLAILPSICRISEPMRFGLPMVMNPYFLIPIVVSNVAQILCTYFAVVVGILPVPHSTSIVGAPYFVTVIMNVGMLPGILWSVFILALTMVISYPFFKAYERHGMLGSEGDEEEEET